MLCTYSVGRVHRGVFLFIFSEQTMIPVTPVFTADCRVSPCGWPLEEKLGQMWNNLANSV